MKQTHTKLCTSDDGTTISVWHGAEYVGIAIDFVDMFGDRKYTYAWLSPDDAAWFAEKVLAHGRKAKELSDELPDRA